MNPPRQAPSSNDAIEWVFSGNYAAVAGMIFCIFMLIVWFQRNDIILIQRKRDWEDDGD